MRPEQKGYAEQKIQQSRPTKTTMEVNVVLFFQLQNMAMNALHTMAMQAKNAPRK